MLTSNKISKETCLSIVQPVNGKRSMEQSNDSELVRMAQNGDRKAFEQLAERYYTMVYRVAYKATGNQEAAEDITQEVFFQLVDKIASFQFRSSFSTWLYRIVMNTAQNVQKRDSIKRDKEANHSDLVLPQGYGSAEDSVALKQVFALVDKLPEKQKEVVLLVLCEGLSHREAADILGCAEATIAWRVFQARKKLQKWIGS